MLQYLELHRFVLIVSVNEERIFFEGRFEKLFGKIRRQKVIAESNIQYVNDE